MSLNYCTSLSARRVVLHLERLDSRIMPSATGATQGAESLDVLAEARAVQNSLMESTADVHVAIDVATGQLELCGSKPGGAGDGEK